MNISYRGSTLNFLALGHSQGHGRTSGPDGGAARPLLLVRGPVVPGRRPLGPGPAGLGGAEGRGTVEAGPHAEGGALPRHAAAGASARWQAADGAVAQGAAPGAGDGGHIQRFHPVGVAVDTSTNHTLFSHLSAPLPKAFAFRLWWCVSVTAFP